MLRSAGVVTGRGIDPEGIAAISRWLSEVTPPGKGPYHWDTPKGLQKADNESTAFFWHPYRGAEGYSGTNRWYCCAQPPANGYDPSGVEIATKISAPLLQLNQPRALNGFLDRVVKHNAQ